MGILQVSNQDPVAFKESGRHYNSKNWRKQSEDLRGKPWEEVFNLIKKQFEYERLDMKKLKELLGRLSPKTNWPNVINNLQDFFDEYERKYKPSVWDEITYTEADELRFERKKLLRELRSRANAQKEQELAMEEKFDKLDKWETLNDRTPKYDERDRDYELQDEKEFVKNPLRHINKESRDLKHGRWSVRQQKPRYSKTEEVIIEDYFGDPIFIPKKIQERRKNKNLTHGGKDEESKRTDKAYEKVRRDKEERRYF